MSTLEKIQEFLRDILDLPTLELKPTTTAREVPGWDSLAHVNLVTSLEAEYGIRFSVAELTRIKNIGDMVTMIDQKKPKDN